MNKDILKSLTKYASPLWKVSKDALMALKQTLPKLAEADFDADSYAPSGDSTLDLYGNVAIISLNGVISFACSPLEEFLGMTDIYGFTEAVQAALDSPLVDKIVLDINSPGGNVIGIAVAAELIRDAEKPIYAFTRGVMASAAYEIGAAANGGVFVTRDSVIGSVGVFDYNVSQMAFDTAQGYQPQLIKAGKYKAMGVAPYNDEELAIKQQEIDDINNQFKADVLLTRDIADEDLQGLVYKGDKAVTLGYADDVLDSIDDLLSLISL